MMNIYKINTTVTAQLPRKMPGLIYLLFCAFLFLIGLLPVKAQTVGSGPATAWETLSNDGFTGLKASKNYASMLVPGHASFQYAAGPKGWYSFGFSDENDGTHDWRDFYGLQADVWVPQGRLLELKVTLYTPKPALRQNFLPETHTLVNLSGGWHHVTLPWSLFDLPDRQMAMLKFIEGFSMDGKFKDGKGDSGEIRIKNIRLTRALHIALYTTVKGKAVAAGATASYEVTVTNCTDSIQSVALSFTQTGFSVMKASAEPSALELKPGSSAKSLVTVYVPADGVAEGGHETQQINVLANGSPANSLSLITARAVPHPYIMHTANGWADVRAKAAKYDWAKKELSQYIKDADEWQVPATYLPPNNYNAAEKHSFVFKDQDYINMQNTAITWQLTRNKKYAQKVALMLVRFADEKTGYPSTYSATNNGGPQEGEDIQRIAIAYDAVLDAGILTDADQKAMERSMRLYMEIFEPDLTQGNMGNWSTSQSTAALFCALSMGDLVSVERYIYGSCGFTDFLSKGVMDDGWWWEVSTGYNLWVATELTQDALACKPWGYDLINLEVPTNYSPYAIIAPWGLTPPYGVSFEKWGPQRRNTRSIKQLWDAIPKVADYRGIAFGMNDGHEEKLGGLRMEIAYNVFRDPAYATLIKLSGQRDLVYGVPELPAETPALYGKSAYAKNIGYSLLRSQTAGRKPEEQIQAVLKTGTQGGFHGHFDRVSLDNLTRYGRSFWNPETIWWGYPNFMYKYYVQSSINHNMVVVDQKQQEAVPSSQILFHSGTMMQVAAQQTVARWCDAPYLGMQYAPGETVQDQMKKNKQSLPLVTDRQYGELGPYTEPVLQRRLAIVTDDYVVLADYLKGSKEHNFDNLLQMKMLTSLTADNKPLKPEHHDALFSNDIHSAAQVITDADWYKATAPVVAKFRFDYGPHADNSGTREVLNEPGTLKIDVHNLWPQQQQLVLAMPPETHDNQQWVNYKVTGDGKLLASGESGIWIRGEQQIDVAVTGLSELSLMVNTTGSKKKALFWSDARLVMANGAEVPVKDITDMQNIEMPPVSGLDYYKGPIKISGNLSPDALPTQPENSKQPSSLKISLQGKNAVRFKATLGGDFPFGPEEARRKIYGSRVSGKEARFLTVLEPYESKAMVKRAVATGPGELTVELNDGRVQQIVIENLDGAGNNIKVTITETKDGEIIRRETTTE
jgi:hypothetical protein